MSKKLMRKKLALMLSNLKKKRKFFCEVEYLESTGTQYINTGLLSTADSKVDIVYGFTSMESGAANNCAIFGGRNNSTTNTFTFFKIASQTPQYFRFDYNSQPIVGTATEMTWNTSSKYRFQYNGTSCITTNTTTGESVTSTRDPGSTFTTSPITLFAVNTNNQVGQFMSGRIYKYWYTDGTNTIDLIPVLDWNGVACMYDKVSGQLFYNQGSGDFTAGREIHYVDYLENITSQASLNYIPTTYTPTTNTNLEAKVRYTGGASGATWAIGAATWWGIHYQGSGPKIGITNSSTDPYQVYAPYTAGNDITLKLDGSNVYADGTLIGSLTKQNASSTLTIFRYATSANLSWVGRIYYLDIWDNNGYVYKFKPAIDSNGTAFLFDQVSHTIYDNASTGNFAYPPVEIEYLESTGSQYIDTGETFASGTDEIELKYENTSTATHKWLFGSYESNANIGISSATITAPTFWYKGNIASTESSQYYSKHTLKYDSNGMSNDGTNLKAFTSYTGTWNLYLFALNNTGTSPNGYFGYGKIWGYKHTRNSSILLDLIPAYKDGQAGMLDKANNVFYQNAGTGTFTAGKIVESEYE